MTPTSLPSDLIRIFVLNDHISFLQSLRRFLETEPDLQVIGIGSASPSGLAPVVAAHPDVVVMDPEIHDLEVGDMVRALRKAIPDTRIIVLTFNDNDHIRDAALEAGADDFIGKMAATEQLVAAIRRAKPNPEPGS